MSEATATRTVYHFKCHACGLEFVDDYDPAADIYSDGSTCPADGEQAAIVEYCPGHAWTALLGPGQADICRAALSVLVASLEDGDVFSTDGGHTWHTCAVVLFGNVAVYSTDQRGGDAPTVRVDAARDARVLVK